MLLSNDTHFLVFSESHYHSIESLLGLLFRMGSDRHDISSFIPISVLTDSYKASHFEQYPDASRMVAVRICHISLITL